MPSEDFLTSLKTLIRSRDCRGIISMFFTGEPPRLKEGFFREDAYWDFKAGCPSLRRENELAWAEIAALVLAFHNADGGVVFFGIDDKSYSFCGTGTPLDARQFNSKIRRYVGDTFWVSFNREFLQPNGLYLGVAVVPPHGVTLKRLQAPAPLKEGKPYFDAGDLPVRIGDETRIFHGPDAVSYLSQKKFPVSGSLFLVDEPGYRIIRPDYDDFINRPRLCHQVMFGLGDDRTYVTSLTGIGGAGKTALACWGVLEAYNARMFEFIVSLSAKDRELSPTGIRPIVPTLTSFSSLLDEILDVTGFSELKSSSDADKETEVRSLIRGERCLLFIDNLETIDDSRILQFLDTLPKPVKAIITSRRARVRHAAYPVDVGVFELPEAVKFLDLQAERRGKAFLLDLPSDRKKALAQASSLLPLVIEWFVGQVKDLNETATFESALTGSTKTGEELLEFCFRRINDQLSPPAKRVLRVMSIFEKPEPLEPIASGAQLPSQFADDALEELRECALVEATHDPRVNSLTYSMLPLTRKFAYSELVRDSKEEAEIRKHLTRYFDAVDIADANQRRLVSEIRLGMRDPETEQLSLAMALRTAGKYEEAERHFTEAVRKNPRSWRAYREAAEYYRHPPISNMREALQLYERAYTWAPKKGKDRALILREYGILLRDSGLPGSLQRARDMLEEALKEFAGKDDSVCRHALGDVYMKLSVRRKAVEVLEPLLNHPYPTQRRKTYPLLEQLYAALGEKVKLVELRDRIKRDAGEAPEEV